MDLDPCCGAVGGPALKDHDQAERAGAGLHQREQSPEDFVARIAPRPFIIIGAEDDERVPRECVELLYDRALEPKELSWMSGQHLHPDRPEVSARLIDAVLGRIVDEG